MKKILVGVTTLIITGLSYGQSKSVPPSPFVKITVTGYSYTNIYDERKEDGTYGDPKPKEQHSWTNNINKNNILTITEITEDKVDLYTFNKHLYINYVYFTYICKTKIKMVNGDTYYINEDIDSFLKKLN